MKNIPVCYIVGAGEFDGLFRMPEDGDLVIAADGGLKYLSELSLAADVAIGDFDSYGGEIPKDAIVLPRMKDDTDTEISVRYGEDRGYAFFLIYGGLGGRLSHTLANIQTLCRMAENGSQGWLISSDTAIRALSAGTVDINEELTYIYGKLPKVRYVSVFAHSDKAIGVSESGMKYEICGAALSNTDPLGVSNELSGRGVITVESGTAVIIIELEKK